MFPTWLRETLLKDCGLSVSRRTTKTRKTILRDNLRDDICQNFYFPATKPRNNENTESNFVISCLHVIYEIKILIFIQAIPEKLKHNIHTQLDLKVFQSAIVFLWQ